MLHRLADRGVVAINGAGARAWLDNLVTNDLEARADVPAVFSGLLSPQGKILFEFFVISHGDSLLLEANAASINGLIKRLTLYRLRTPVTLTDVSAEWVPVWAVRTSDVGMPSASGAIIYADPRAPDGLWRGVAPVAAAPASEGNYSASRVALGVAEAPTDYALGDAFPHEANFDQRHGVSFKKGCFIGQEVVARMQNKSVVRTRVVRLLADSALQSGADVLAGTVRIGGIGTVAGHAALAMLRLDRAVEAIGKGDAISVGGVRVHIHQEALDTYRQAVANRPEILL